MTDTNEELEAAIDDDAVDKFARLMKKKMALSRANGRHGWADPAQCSPDYLRAMLYEHVYKGDPVDVANFCMMLRHYDELTTPRPEDDLRLPRAERDAAVAQALERAEAKIALLQRALERTDEGLDYMGLYAPTPAPAGKEGGE